MISSAEFRVPTHTTDSYDGVQRGMNAHGDPFSTTHDLFVKRPWLHYLALLQNMVYLSHPRPGAVALPLFEADRMSQIKCVT